MRVLRHRLWRRLLDGVQASGHDRLQHQSRLCRSIRARPPSAPSRRYPTTKPISAWRASSTKLTGDKRFERYVAASSPRSARTCTSNASLTARRSLRGYQHRRPRGTGEARRPGAYEHALLSAHQLATSKSTRASPGSPRPGGSNSTGPKSSSSRRARISQSTVNRSDSTFYDPCSIRRRPAPGDPAETPCRLEDRAGRPQPHNAADAQYDI